MTDSRAVPPAKTERWLVTHQRLLNAAVFVFLELGYDGATMEDIAVRAGVVRRTAFNHFVAKSDIAVEWAIRRAERAVMALAKDSFPVSETPARVRAYFHELAVMTERDWDETREFMTGWMRSFGTPTHRSWVAREVSSWLAEWGRDPVPSGWPASVDGLVVVDILFDVFQGLLQRRFGTGSPSDGFVAEADAAIAFASVGLDRVPSGRSGRR